MSTPNQDKRTAKSIDAYIDSLQERHSKILAIRIDLGYTKEHAANIDLADLKKDVKHLLDNRRSKPSLFQTQIGYVLKYENASEKWPHRHALFLFDGQKTHKDAFLADQIGKYWSEVITRGEGIYHNCNREKNSYEQCGIGMLDHTDHVKRAALKERVIPYLLKSEQSIGPIKSSGKERSITKGALPKSRNT
jgi:hypothetical protein